MAGPLISACDSSGSNGGESSDVLIPLEEGNQWTADVSGEFSGTASAEVVSGSEVSLTLLRDGNSMETILTVSQQSDGLLLESVSDVEETDIIFLKYPAEVGDTYQHTDENGNTFEVEVSRTSTSVPAGDYSGCLEYEIRELDGGDLRSIVTIKPGVGPVRVSSFGNRYTLTSTNVDG